MGILKSYSRGFKHSIKSPRMLLILYAVNIFTALILVLPFYSVLKTSFSGTTEITELLKNFSFSVFTDLIYTSGSALKSIFTQIKWIGLLYWIISIFLVGGVIRVLTKERFSVTEFFSGASTYFFRFLGSNIIVLLMHLILFLIIWVPYFFITKAFFDIIENEKILIIITFAVFVFYAALSVIILMINDYAKFYMVLNNTKNIFKAIFSSWRYIFRNFFKTYFLYLLLLLVPVAIYYIYFKLSGDIGVATFFGLALLFVVQQVFVFIKVWLKVWFYASQFDLYTADYLLKEKLKLKEIFEKAEEKFNDIKDDIFKKEEV